MIKEKNNIDLINGFLSFFNTEYVDNPFRKYIVYDDIAILVYSEIYDRLEIDYIYVLDEYRNHGIASKLLDYLFSKYSFSCSLEVRCDNVSAINLYKKYDFKIVSIRNNYYGNIDGYLMIRKWFWWKMYIYLQ